MNFRHGPRTSRRATDPLPAVGGSPVVARKWSMVLQVSFVRHRGHRDHVYVSRSDGSSTGWEFPSYGDDLPHDLCHLVVEDELGITDGFWGLVDQGTDVKLINNQATLVRGGKPIVENPGLDFSDLSRAERAVALLAPFGLRARQSDALAVARLDLGESGPSAVHLISELGFDLSEGTPEELLSLIQRRLEAFRREWQSLDDGAAIMVTYAGRSD